MRIIPWFIVRDKGLGWQDNQMEDTLEVVDGPFWFPSAAQEALDALRRDPLESKAAYDVKQIELMASVR